MLLIEIDQTIRPIGILTSLGFDLSLDSNFPTRIKFKVKWLIILAYTLLGNKSDAQEKGPVF